MSGFSDIHVHFVYGVDDGAKTKEDMERMLDAAHADGMALMIGTSHVTPGVQPFPQALYDQHIEEARAYCREKGYSIQIFSGAEILYTPAIEPYARERKLPTLGGSSRILMEFVPDVSYHDVEYAVSLMENSGYLPILAHIERYPCLRKGAAYRLKERHRVKFQVNCSTVIDQHRLFSGRYVKGWLKDRLINYVATDSHNCTTRPTRMREAYGVLEAMVGEPYARKLTGWQD